MQIADDFIENVVTASCKIAKHRKSSSLDIKDVQLQLGVYLVVVSKSSNTPILSTAAKIS